MKHKGYMLRALELAKRGFGAVEPNPLVGCVIIDSEGNTLGEGWHKVFGSEHAEINALNDCLANGKSPRGATMCVTLEPCCHHGKTPPCTDAIIKAGISKVVIAMLDPSEKVAGKGVQKLEAAGIKVSIGTCEKQARLLNAAFIKHSATGLPWVILKWAQTIDGKLSAAGMPARQRWITNESSRKDTHKLRRSCQAILVGIDTALADDPLLTARDTKARNPIRVILDSKLRIEPTLKLFSTIDEADLLIVTTKKTFDKNLNKVKDIIARGAEILALEQDENGRCCLQKLLENLGKNGVQRLVVEGGARVLASFISQEIADEAVIYIAAKLFSSQGQTSLPEHLGKIDASTNLYNTKTALFDGDVRITATFKP